MPIDLVADEFGLLHAAVPHPRSPGTNVQVMVLKAEDGWWAYVDGQRVDGQFRSSQQANRAAAKEVKTLPGAAAAAPLTEASTIAASARPTFQPAKRKPRVPFTLAGASFALIFFAAIAVAIHATGLLEREATGPAVTAAPVPPAVWSFAAREGHGGPQDRYDGSRGELRMTAALTNATASEVPDIVPTGSARYTVIPAAPDSLEEFVAPRSGGRPLAAAPSSATFARLRIEERNDGDNFSGTNTVEDEATQNETFGGPAFDRQPPAAGNSRASRAASSAARLRRRAARDRSRRRGARLRSTRRSRVRKVRRRSSRLRAAIRRDRRRKIKRLYKQAFRRGD